MASYKLRPLYTRAVPAQRSCAAGRLQRQPLGRPRAEPSTRTCLVYFRHEDVSVSPDPGETLLEVANRAGVNIPSGCNSGSCGICEVAVYKYSAGQGAGAEAVVRSCIARVPPGYARIEVDVLDDPMRGSDGWDT